MFIAFLIQMSGIILEHGFFHPRQTIVGNANEGTRCFSNEFRTTKKKQKKK